MQPTDIVRPALTRAQCDIAMQLLDAAVRSIGLRAALDAHQIAAALQEARDAQPETVLDKD